MNHKRLQAAIGMSEDQLDGLPFGAIVVDVEGTVRRYNAFESKISRLDPDRVVGRNFFRDIAPCTAVLAFEGRMKEFVASDDRVSVTFDYRFAFAHGATDVAITFMKTATDEVLIAIDHNTKPGPAA